MEGRCDLTGVLEVPVILLVWRGIGHVLNLGGLSASEDAPCPIP